MDSEHHGSIRSKLIWIIVLTCCAAVLAACAIFGTYDLHIARKSELQGLKTLTEITGNNATAALAFDDSEAGKTILNSLRADPQIVHAALYTSKGEVLATFDSDAGHKDFAPPKPETDGVAVAKNRIRALFTVKLNGNSVGTIYLESTTAHLVQREQGLAIMGSVSLLMSLLVALLLGSRLQQGISNPILELAKTAFTVSVEKNYSVRAAVKGSDEIAFLYEQFNEMLDGIQKRDNQLRKARAQLEERVAERTAYLNALVETSPLGILTIDPSGKIRICNATFEQYFQYSREEAIGADLNSLLVPPQLAEEAADLMRRGRSGEMVQAITQRRRKDGSLLDVELYGTRLAVGDEQVGGLVLYQDISERKRAEAALRAAKEAAEGANRAKSEFLANMSHEIRTPMNGIIGMTQLALEAKLSPEVREYLGMVKSSADSLLTLLNDILDYSKIEAGKIEFESVPFALRENLGQTMKTLGHAAHRKGLELAWEVAPNVPEWLVGDCGRLRQVLMNLVGNGIKFTESGEIVVSAELQGSSEKFAELHFTVRDTGIGIASEKQRLIFAAFTQADASTTRKYGGTGLGLTIVQRLVSMMGGDLQVESELGRGSTFHFNVRLGFPEKSFVPPVAAEPSTLRNLRVLIVDDNETNRVILAEIFKQWGMAPCSAASANEALDALRRGNSAGKPFQLAVIDAQMPETDGFMLAQQIKRHGEFPELTMIMLSSVSLPEDAEKRREAGIAAVLTKPAQPSELLNMILVAKGRSSLRAAQDHEPATPTTSGRRLRILLAEDNDVNRRLATKLLEKHGHFVIAASNGREALALLEQGPIDLILMDAQMPEMDGLEAMRIIREKEKHSGGHIPIISVTARAMKGDRENCLQAGADDYVSKPLQPSELFSAIERRCPDVRESSSGLEIFGEIADASKMLERCQGDCQLLAEIIDLFQGSSEALLQDIATALKRGDTAGLASAAHTLKGAIGNFTATGAYLAAEKLEHDARHNDLSAARANFSQLEAAVQQLRMALKKYGSAKATQAIDVLPGIEAAKI
jgi:two-component system sensor histidine kinase/response regulator